MKEGEQIQPGSEMNEATMSLQLISGQLAFESLGNEMHLQEGELLTLHQQLSFKASAITDCICLLTMLK